MKANILIITFVLIQVAFLKIMAQNSNISNKKIEFSDPYAFKTAIDMYEIAPTLPYDGKADRLVKKISKTIGRGYPIENEDIWSDIKKLEPYRMHPNVQAAVTDWVDKCADRISKQRKVRQVRFASLQTISKNYKAGDFEQTIKACNVILLESPQHYDVRSNLALALMHLNRDLCAQIELEIICKLSSRHIPAMLNLTVVYERLNKREEAEKMAATLTQLALDHKIDMPSVGFNEAWYQFQNGNTQYADTLLNRSNR